MYKLSNDHISLLTSIDFCRLLIAFANSLDPDQNRQKLFDTDSIPERFFENFNFEKSQQATTAKNEKLPSMQLKK